MFAYHQDIYVPGADLWLDPRSPKPRAFISHAHGDHIRHHDWVLATPATLVLCRHRLGTVRGEPLEYGVTRQLGTCRVTLHPAGHILGSAQIRLEEAGRRLVYTGDIALRPSSLVTPCEIVPSEELILECTYGRPHYRFPRREQVVEELASFVRAVLAEGRVPVVLAYTLGRAQEVTHELGTRGFSIAVADPIYRMHQVYEELGVRLPAYERLGTVSSRGKVVLMPPQWGASSAVKRLHRPVRIAVTGWAIGGAEKVPYPVERAFPISDHADFEDLVTYVSVARPARVFTIHGFPDFARHLHERGVAATNLC
ncbi:MAG: MBL fold metallo-hydrolase [Planctomycetota bacterium]